MGILDFIDSLFKGANSPRSVVITDVTRMDGDKVCVAALCGGKSIRLNTPQPTDEWITSIGGLSPGDQISVVWIPAKRYTPPHKEDGRWSPPSCEKQERTSREDFVALLDREAFMSVRRAFGKPAFFSPRGNPVFSPHRGSSSLATLRVSDVSVYPSGNGVRADFADSEDDWRMVPVVDLAVRTHQRRCPECFGGQLEQRLADEFSGGEALLRIGLGRAFQAEQRQPGCYLQVNHVIPVSPHGGHFMLS